MPSYYLIFVLSLFCFSACATKPALVRPCEELPNGVLVFRRTNKVLNQDFSQKKTLKILQKSLQKENLDQNLNLTLSFSRLTIAGQLNSLEDLQKIIGLAFEQTEITEIITTVIIAGDKNQEATL